MAYGMNCYCCGVNPTSEEHFYCCDCLVKLDKILRGIEMCFNGEEVNIYINPSHAYHCVSCGEHDNRRIIVSQAYAWFICDKCVESELLQYVLEDRK
jgi:hypothetical protein